MTTMKPGIKSLLLISLLLYPILTILFVQTGSVFIPLWSIGDERYAFIIYNIRLPAAIGAIAIGAILGVSGALMQLLFRNPLLDPYTAGTAPAAAFGAILSTLLVALLKLPGTFILVYQVPISFIMALIATAAAIAIGKGDPYATIMAGVVMAFVFSGLNVIAVTYLSTIDIHAPALLTVILGDVGYIPWNYVALFVLSAIVLTALGVVEGRRVDLVAISDELSTVRGILPDRYRLVWLSLVSLFVGLVVAWTGVIGFVGLMAPHIVRLLLRNESATVLIPGSAALGGLVLLAAGVISRGALGIYVPVTSVTSVMASPLFLYLLLRVRRYG